MSATTARLQDRLPYPPAAHAHTHPARLAAIARAAGLAAPDVATARVLELGCGAGWNLLPMAARLPGARFVGLDHAAQAIDEGADAARALGLGNIELVSGDLLDVGRAAWSRGWAGAFDYVIAHGVWSWVPPAVRASLRDAIGLALAPGGLAFVSFNALPGWASRGAIADTMRRHVADLAEPRDRVNEALGLLAALAAHTPDAAATWRARLELEAEFLRGTPPSYLFHDHLAPDVSCAWVSDVIDELATVGLTFVGDAEPGVHRHLTDAARATLVRMASGPAMAEHLLDAAAHVSFRRLVLARARAGAPTPRPVPADLVVRLPAPPRDGHDDRPTVCPVARLELARGHERVTNLRHESVAVGPRARTLAPRMDGTRPLSDLGPDADAALAELAAKDLLIA